MPVAVLIANPQVQPLSRILADGIRGELDGDELTWLATDEACEFRLKTAPGRARIEMVRRRLRESGTDIAVVSDDHRRKRLLLADMDSTMILEESLDELAARAGVGDDVARITRAAMNGEIGFEDAVRRRVGRLRGLETSAIDAVLHSSITLAPGGAELVATMKAHGAHTVLISGGFTDFTEVVAHRLEFDEFHANRLLRRDGRLTGEVATPILGREAKVERLNELTRRLGLKDRDVVAVGDGANDLGMLRRAGIGVALHPKPTVAAAAEIVLDFADLAGLLFLQGYRRDAFVLPTDG